MYKISHLLWSIISNFLLEHLPEYWFCYRSTRAPYNIEACPEGRLGRPPALGELETLTSDQEKSRAHQYIIQK